VKRLAGWLLHTPPVAPGLEAGWSGPPALVDRLLFWPAAGCAVMGLWRYGATHADAACLPWAVAAGLLALADAAFVLAVHAYNGDHT
jgi:hypothetical protein